MKQFWKNNLVFLSYFLYTIILEFITLFIVTNSILIHNIWISILLFIANFLIYNLISNKKGKLGLVFSLGFIHILICLLSVLLFENTGTYFEYSMFFLVGGAEQFAGTIAIHWGFVIFVILLYTVFILVSRILAKQIDSSFKFRYQNIVCAVLLVCATLGQVGALTYYNNTTNEEYFINSLYRDTNVKYSSYGNVGNFVNELAKMTFFNNYNGLSDNQIKEYIYKETNTENTTTGISKGNNLVTILVESLEWFAFTTDTKAYPKGANLSEEQLDLLFPNLRSFYKSSLSMSNHHALNKTDLSEDEALLGAYPSSAYINYNFPNTTLPSSMANMLKSNDENISNRFFHNNDFDFYNRTKVVTSLGYDELFFIEDMTKKGVTNYFKSKDSSHSNCMNLDSEMFEKMKDDMFPTDVRFNTHITTLSMHGSYVERVTMKKYLEKMESLNIYIENDHLRNYLSYVMDFDYALGIMMDDLENKGLLENTTIVLFGDHNAYMSNLTYQVKDINIDEYDADNYTELYRVPLMIYDNNIGFKSIDKFTTTYDITPTILDMFGVKYYTNLYYGNSIFSDSESVLYSKGFDVFIAEGLYFSNINNPLFKRDDVTSENIEEIEKKALTLLKKIYYMNNIFESNYFKDSDNMKMFNDKINSLKVNNN